MELELVTAPTTWAAFLGRLVAATLLGAGLGLDRELSDKPAGLRTHALVALGAALFSLVPLQLMAPGGAVDLAAVSRVVQGVVAGVGFIGAGVILHQEDGRRVHGLTTAASIWLAAALGVAAALGLWRVGILVLVLALLLLSLGARLEQAIHRWRSKE